LGKESACGSGKRGLWKSRSSDGCTGTSPGEESAEISGPERE
jgi:hypothetical protein